ncbi:hypothetical protein ACIGZJ_30765 [Kitasatospora sp. NPDC052868]|uniref:hypothetical protein n=1 Tax=Kitasatospora sp. NPDC052868 TaxID=3364060 RepID=UPI0037C92C37
MRLTAALLAVLLAGTTLLWRWERERWRRALTTEQLHRARERLTAQAQAAELHRAMDEWATAASDAIEAHRRPGEGPDLERLHLLLWERQNGWEDPK